MGTQDILFTHDAADTQPTYSFGQSEFGQSAFDRSGPERPRGVQANFGRPRCPRCGKLLLIAERSEFHFTGWIRNSWRCDDCAHTFETAIALRPR